MGLIRDNTPLFFDKRQRAAQNEMALLIARLAIEPRAARLAAIKLSLINPFKLGSRLRLALQAPCLICDESLSELFSFCAPGLFGHLESAGRWHRCMQSYLVKGAFIEGSFGALLAARASDALALLDQEHRWRIASSGCSER